MSIEQDSFALDVMSDLAVLEQATLVDQFQPNAGGEEQLFVTRKHQVILSGANNSGKTYTGLMRDAHHLVPELDETGAETGYALHPNLRIRLDPMGMLGWISSYSQDVQLDTIQPLIGPIFDPYIKERYAEEGVLHWFTTKHGRVNFKWQTQSWRSYRGPKLDFIHMDEPHSEQIYNECVARLFQKKGYLWITMTPVVDTTTSPGRVRDVIWMLKKLVEPWLRNRDNFPELDIIFIDLEENAAYMDTEFVKNMLAGVSEDEYIIRTTGRFIIMIGTTWFSERRLDKLQIYQMNHPGECIPEYGELHRRREDTEDDEDVYFEPSAIDDYPDEPDEGFIVRIWQRPIKEQLGVRPIYHIGADLAEGAKGSDYSCAYVKRQDTRQIVASLHGRMDETEAARQLHLLGSYYRNPDGRMAKLAIEVNNVGKTTMSSLLNGHKELGIRPYDTISLYQRPALDDLEMGLHIPSSVYGWYTTGRHREFLQGAMRMALAQCLNSTDRRGPCLIPDSGWLSEARTFVKNSRGKYEAAQGFYDDRLLAAAICDMSVEQGVFTTPVYRPRRAEIRDPEPAFLDDPSDPKGVTTILNLKEIRRRAEATKREQAQKIIRAAGDYYP